MANKNGLILLTPSSVNKTGTGSTATINTNGSVTFSTCATLSLNGVFTSTYDNYMIVCRYVASSVTSGDMRLRYAGTDSTATTDYNYQQLFALGTSIQAARSTSSGIWEVGSSYAAQRSGYIVNLYGPYLSQPTAYRTCAVGDNTNANTSDMAGTHELSSSYDGFTLSLNPTVTMTGLVAVYGMRN